MTAPLLSIAGLRDGFLDIPELTVGACEIVALLGPNGAGKTRLIEALVGLGKGAGEIYLSGRRIDTARPEERARLGLGYVPQGRRLFPGLTVRDTLLMASHADRVERQARLRQVLALFPDLAERRGARAWQLSGGQQQMLAIGRAMMAGPSLLVLDEPSVGLAPKLAAGLLATLPEIASTGAGILLAEQNARAALNVAARGYVLRQGAVAATGTAAALKDDAALAGLFLSG